MAILEKNGYEFFVQGDKIESLILHGLDFEKELQQCKNENINSLVIQPYWLKNKNISLDFLADYPFIESITIGLVVDFKPLYYLKNLKYFSIEPVNKIQYLDFSKFPDLETLCTDWYKQFPDLSNNHKLKNLMLFKYSPISKSLQDLQLPGCLESLDIRQTNIINLEGIHQENLRVFCLYGARNLTSVQGIKNISNQLTEIDIESCRKLINYEELSVCSSLQRLDLTKCGDMQNLSWIKNLNNLNHFTFLDTKILDGDISPCHSINYVAFINSKNYNYYFKDFKFYKKEI